ITLPATSCSLTFTSPGSQSVTAAYNGDTNFSSSSTAGSTAHTVNTASTTVSITNAAAPTRTPSVLRQNVSVSPNLPRAPPGRGTADAHDHRPRNVHDPLAHDHAAGHVVQPDLHFPRLPVGHGRLQRRHEFQLIEYGGIDGPHGQQGSHDCFDHERGDADRHAL